MTRIILLERLRAFTEEVTADLIMPTRLQKGDTEQSFRPAKVYLTRLPEALLPPRRLPMCCTRSLPAWINSRKGSV